MVTGTIKSQGEKQPKLFDSTMVKKFCIGGMAVTVKHMTSQHQQEL